MLGLEINGEFLDLDPDTTLELEQENPFLQFGDDVLGEYSFPFEVRSTEKNLRLLNYAGFLQKRIDNTGVDAKAYDGTIQHSIGKIKIEKPSVNVNHNHDGKMSCYYLPGSSN